ncbi:MAG: hypothetical protein KBG09_06315 [Syntrophobacterales bacterium]|jgi:uncharacterized protein with gpF-like domain|nr:hypothetical protein [Syntrophobacterales bacterium]
MNKESAFNKKIKALIKEADRLEEQAVVRAIRLLEQSRKEVAATVAATEWQAHNLAQLKTAVERSLQEFARRFGMEIADSQGRFWDMGVEMVDAPLRAAGVMAVIPAIDTQALAAMQNYSAHLINSLGQEAAAKVYNEMALGMIGQKTPFEVMEAVGKNLKDKGTFHSIAARAETITRVETGRALAMASQSRMEEAAKVVPGLKKKWVYGAAHRKMPRFAHMGVDGQVRDVDKPFEVAGVALMYPRDPAGPPGQTINCRCYSAPYMEAWEAAA